MPELNPIPELSSIPKITHVIFPNSKYNPAKNKLPSFTPVLILSLNIPLLTRLTPSSSPVTALYLQKLERIKKRLLAKKRKNDQAYNYKDINIPDCYERLRALQEEGLGSGCLARKLQLAINNFYSSLVVNGNNENSRADFKVQKKRKEISGDCWNKSNLLGHIYNN